jgi:formylglycine-generating enzyme required for sulfatase activity
MIDRVRVSRRIGASLAVAVALAAATPRAQEGSRGTSAVAPQKIVSAWIVVPAGEFWMGRTRLYLMDEIGWNLRERMDDRPVHRVELDAFAIGAHEVTNAEYAAHVKATGGEPPFHWGGAAPPAGKERHPVYNVSWFEAAKYCQAGGGRLPTEAEWERAARGGVADLDYPWGNDFADAAAGTTPPARRAHSGSSTGPVAVGSFAPNGFGLYDVVGNMWEWTSDWYDLHYYSQSPVKNPTGPPAGLYRVIRGGSWADTETRLLTVYYRNFTEPETAQPTIGFRCVRPAAAVGR